MDSSRRYVGQYHICLPPIVRYSTSFPLFRNTENNPTDSLNTFYLFENYRFPISSLEKMSPSLVVHYSKKTIFLHLKMAVMFESRIWTPDSGEQVIAINLLVTIVI